MGRPGTQAAGPCADLTPAFSVGLASRPDGLIAEPLTLEIGVAREPAYTFTGLLVQLGVLRAKLV